MSSYATLHLIIEVYKFISLKQLNIFIGRILQRLYDNSVSLLKRQFHQFKSGISFRRLRFFKSMNKLQDSSLLVHIQTTDFLEEFLLNRGHVIYLAYSLP